MGELKELGGAGMVQLAGAGEPFLHPGIWEIIETIKESGLRCSIITNFSMLDDKGIQRLVDLGVDAITASIWAGDPQTYLKTHPGAPTDLFDRIRDRLSRLAQLKPAGGIPKVKLYHVISTENADTMAEMVDLPLQVGADAVEFQMVDVVPGKTDALRPDRSVQDRILEQFEAIRKRPDYTEELVRLDHLEPFEDEVLCRELTEFGRIYPRLPEGFSYLPFHNAVRCPCGVGSIEKHISWRKEPITFVFDPESCEHCAQRTACWERAAAGGRLNVHPVSILGGGSFLRRLGSSGLEIQQYERQIIDRVPCTVGWTYSRITVEGNVLPCCKASDFPLGNIHKDSFRRIWQSRAYSTFRQKAKELPKNDPYFSRIQCYKSCDNLGMNLMTHLRFINYQKNQER
jgi:radical SAM protein with 4Fe4S-binding SPASM domain